MSNLLQSLNDVSLSFGGKPLFEELNLHINAYDRLCLIGQNGAGKTTLMKLLLQEIEVDSGKQFILPGTTIGYLAQNITFDPSQKVKDFVLSGLNKEDQNEGNAYLADMVIEPLGLKAESLMKPLSGGQLRRAALAQALVQNPDILLLDEPTNHLDLQTIEWLENYLKKYKGAFICISHDRTFLANISQKVLFLDRGHIKTCPFGYAQFDDWFEKQVEQEARELQNLKKKVEAEHSWTQGGVSARRKRNVRRLRELGNLREKLKKDKAAYQKRSQKIEMDALETPNSSKIVAEFKNVSKSFQTDNETIPILDEFNHMILKGDRLGILGKNGSGKSTFLKLLTKEVEQDKGHIFRSKTMNISYFDQNRSDLDPNKTLWETLCPNGGQDITLGSGEDAPTMHVCGYLKRFLFDPKNAYHKVSTLSGGQQNRLLLAKILSSPGNLLILDEPTNDLDMETLDMLQDMLADYPGTLIIVSHDRDFLDRTVTEVLAFEGDGKIEAVFGGYSDYINFKKKRHKPKSENATASTLSQNKKEHTENKPQNAIKKLTYGERLELEKIPNEIEKAQQKIKKLQEKLDDASLYERDPKAFQKTIDDFDAIKKTIESLEERWLELEERKRDP